MANKERVKDEYFMTGCQYYIAGRYAAFAWLNPVVGNLLHHAIEMYLKGTLSIMKTTAELKKLGHHLPSLWREFKAQIGDASLDRFDGPISTLHDFEEIRYPEPVLEKGMLSTIEIIKEKSGETGGGQSTKMPQYKLCVQEIDELVAAIFVAASRNPKAFSRFSDHAKQYLGKANVEISLIKT
jgi:hypothetical protein